jgi:hypothetical protein
MSIHKQTSYSDKVQLNLHLMRLLEMTERLQIMGMM